MISWDGWVVDEERSRLVEPDDIPLARAQLAVAATLLRGAAGIVPVDSLADAVARFGSLASASGRRSATSAAAHDFNKKVGFAAITNVRGIGYRMEKASLREEGYRAILEAILVDEFEATGPHARAAARRIEEALR